jgi:hypothetical protein
MSQEISQEVEKARSEEEKQKFFPPSRLPVNPPLGVLGAFV